MHNIRDEVCRKRGDFWIFVLLDENFTIDIAIEIYMCQRKTYKIARSANFQSWFIILWRKNANGSTEAITRKPLLKPNEVTPTDTARSAKIFRFFVGNWLKFVWFYTKYWKYLGSKYGPWPKFLGSIFKIEGPWTPLWPKKKPWVAAMQGAHN